MPITTLLRVVEDRDMTFSKLFFAKGKGQPYKFCLSSINSVR